MTDSKGSHAGGEGSLEEDPMSLYPFLEGHCGTPRAALSLSVAEKVRASVSVKHAFFERSGGELIDAAEAVAEVYRRGGRLFTMGNGGSSCDAAHFAVEFLHPVTAGRPALSAVHLGADTAMLTAVGNDVGFDKAFVRQLIAQARAGDGVVGFSTSGNSRNLIAAFEAAKERGLTTIGFAGGDGGAMARIPALDHCLVVRSASIHRVQETHVAAYHILWDLVHTLLADARRGGDGAAPP